MTINNATIIIADDLTGANDTSLQYFRNGKNSKIIIDLNQALEVDEDTQVWAYSTESRNISNIEAYDKIKEACIQIKDKLEINSFYKKIDSTLRGNVGTEIVAMLEVTQKDAAIVCPAYIEENRTTIGAYQLLNGIPIERTQCALDPKAPIFESYIPDILKKNINSNFSSTVATLGLNIVSKGAAPIITKLKELIENGKKIIVVDAMSKTDLEQIALAINKCGFDILPCGSAGLANALNKTALNTKKEEIKFKKNLARFIISGSATQLSAIQITKLKEEKNVYCIDLTTQNIISGIDDKLIHEISQKLLQGIDVIVHSSNISKEIASEEAENILIDAGIAKKDFPGKITDYLADLAYEVNLLSDFILIVIGGETSFKCAKKINSKYLQILDAIKPAVPLCIDENKKIIITKSGNFGSNTTLIDIINYFEDRK